MGESAAADEGQPLLDWDGARQRLGSSEATLRTVTEVLRERLPAFREGLRSAIADEDMERLRATAHTIKGAVGFLGAVPVVRVALALEQHADALIPDDRARRCAELDGLIDRMQAELDAAMERARGRASPR